VTSASAEWEVAYRSVEHNLDDRIAKIREFDLDNSMRVLDLGCGDGIDLEAFRDLGFSSVFGIDISHSLLQALRDSGFSMLNCDVYDIALQDGAVDLVYGNNVLHHFRALERAMAEIRRGLRPGGVFCCAEPRATMFRRLVDVITLSPFSKMSKTLNYRRIILEEEMDDYQQWLAGQDQFFAMS
jgi:SAM-dependent methyltransferase